MKVGVQKRVALVFAFVFLFVSVVFSFHFPFVRVNITNYLLASFPFHIRPSF